MGDNNTFGTNSDIISFLDGIVKELAEEAGVTTKSKPSDKTIKAKKDIEIDITPKMILNDKDVQTQITKIQRQLKNIYEKKLKRKDEGYLFYPEDVPETNVEHNNYLDKYEAKIDKARNGRNLFDDVLGLNAQIEAAKRKKQPKAMIDSLISSRNDLILNRFANAIELNGSDILGIKKDESLEKTAQEVLSLVEALKAYQEVINGFAKSDSDKIQIGLPSFMKEALGVISDADIKQVRSNLRNTFIPSATSYVNGAVETIKSNINKQYNESNRSQNSNENRVKVDNIKKEAEALENLNEQLKEYNELKDKFVNEYKMLVDEFHDFSNEEAGVSKIVQRLKELYQLRNENGFEKNYGNEIVTLMDFLNGAGQSVGNKNIEKYFSNPERFKEARQDLQSFATVVNNTSQSLHELFINWEHDSRGGLFEDFIDRISANQKELSIFLEAFPSKENITQGLYSGFEEVGNKYDELIKNLNNGAISGKRAIETLNEELSKAVPFNSKEQGKEEVNVINEEVSAIEQLTKQWSEYLKLKGKDNAEKRSEMRTSMAQFISDNGIDFNQLKPSWQKELKSAYDQIVKSKQEDIKATEALIEVEQKEAQVSNTSVQTQKNKANSDAEVAHQMVSHAMESGRNTSLTESEIARLFGEETAQAYSEKNNKTKESINLINQESSAIEDNTKKQDENNKSKSTDNSIQQIQKETAAIQERNEQFQRYITIAAQKDNIIPSDKTGLKTIDSGVRSAISEQESKDTDIVIEKKQELIEINNRVTDSINKGSTALVVYGQRLISNEKVADRLIQQLSNKQQTNAMTRKGYGDFILIDESTEESNKGLIEEEQKFEEVGQSAEEAAKKKDKFAKANEGVKESIGTSVVAIAEEQKSFESFAENSTKSFEDFLNGANLSEWVERIKSVVKELNENPLNMEAKLNKEQLFNDFDLVASELAERFNEINGTTLNQSDMSSAFRSLFNEVNQEYQKFQKPFSDNTQIKNMITSIGKLKKALDDIFKGDSTSIQKFIQYLREVETIYNNINNNATEGTKQEARFSKEQAFTKLYDDITNLKSFKNLRKDTQIAIEKMFSSDMLGDIDGTKREIDGVAESIHKVKIEASEQRASFIDKLGKMAKSGVGRLTTYYLSMMHLTRYAREAVNAVRELDTALTELRVVSNASDYSLQQISKQAFELGQRLGSTTAEIVKSITDWRRLGESIEDSLILAEQAARLSVGGLMDVSSATESLVSAMKAYGYEVSEVSSIVDKFIYIGNNYSITSEDLATSLEKSSGALVAAGNSLEEAVALEVAGNTVIQDANNVSNALKAVAMRLRGTTGSALEEIGEDTEGLVENASKLYDIVKNLTKTVNNPEGVEIINKANNSYKSTYQILLEISKVWNEIGDVQQAELLEKLAGKVRGSAVAAILSQGDILENAYYDAMNKAEGAGEQAIENSLNSIEKKLQQFRNETKNLMNDVINSSTIKNLVDLGTQVISILDKIIPKISLLGATFGTLVGGSLSKALHNKITGQGFTLFGISNYLKESKESSSFSKNEWRALNNYINAIKKGSSEVDAFQKHISGLNGPIRSVAEGLNKNSASFGVWSAKAKAAVSGTTVLKSELVSLGSIAAGLAISFGISWLNDYVAKQKEAIKQAHEAYEAYKKESEGIADYKKEIEELGEKLSKEGLSEDEVKNTRIALYEIQKKIIEQYGDEIEGIDLLNKSYEDAIEILEKYNQEKAKTQRQRLEDKKEEAEEYLNTNITSAYDNLLIGVLPSDIQDIFTEESYFDATRGNAEDKLATIYDRIEKYKNNNISILSEQELKTIDNLLERINTKIETIQKDSNIQDRKKIINDYNEALAIEDGRYEQVTDAIERYNKAIVGTDAKETTEAYNNLKNVRQEINNLFDKSYRDSLLSKIDSSMSNGYSQIIDNLLYDENNDRIQFTLSKIFDGKDWMNVITELKAAGKNGGYNLTKSFAESILGYADIPKDAYDILVDRLEDFAKKRGEASIDKIEPLSYSDWIRGESDISKTKNGKEDKYTNNELIDTYKSSISALSEYIKNAQEGKIEVNLNDVIKTVASDELYKSLGMDDLETYFKEYGENIDTVSIYIGDAFRKLYESIDWDSLSEEGQERLLSQLSSMQVEAIGGIESIRKLYDSYDDLTQILKQVDDGYKYQEDELRQLLIKYPALEKAIIKYSDHTYSVQSNAIKDLINEYGGLANEALTAYKKMQIGALEVKLANWGLALSAEHAFEIYEDAYNKRQGLDLRTVFGNTSHAAEIEKYIAETEKELKTFKEYGYNTVDYKKESGSGSNTKNKDNEIDWIANSLENIQKEIDKTQEKYDRLLTTFGSTKALKKANNLLIGKDENDPKSLNYKLQKQIDGYQQAYDEYNKELENMGLNKKELALIKNVALGNESAWKIERFKNGNEADQERYEKYTEALKYYQAAQDALAKKREKEHQKTLNEIQALQNEYDYLAAKQGKYEAKLTLATSAKQQAKITTKIIALQDEEYKKQIEIAKKKKDTIEATRLEYEWEQKTNESIAQRRQYYIDEINTKYDRKVSEFENRKSILEHGIAMTEANGSMVSVKYYEALIDNEKKIAEDRLAEREKLVAELNRIESEGIKSTEDLNQWWDTKDKIDEVTAATYAAEEAMVEYGNAIRQVKWDLFDRIQSTISGIKDEADYLIEAMSNKDMYNYIKETFNDGSTAKIYQGDWSAEGDATLGLRELKMKTDIELVQKYREEIEDLNKELASKPTDLTLLDRRNELIAAEREAALAVEQEKDAIIDLVKDGYDKQLSSMQTLIDKYVECIQQEKELFEYQKNIQKQTEDIAKLRKRMASLAGDQSEEARSRRQQLQVQLKDAQEGLRDTQYDHYLSDQQAILDKMYSQFESFLNDKLDDRETLLKEMSKKVDSNKDVIKQTLVNTGNNLGTGITNTMDNIWSSAHWDNVSIQNMISPLDTDLDAIIESTTTADTLLSNFFGNYNIDNINTSIQSVNTSIQSVTSAINSLNTNLGERLKPNKNDELIEEEEPYLGFDIGTDDFITYGNGQIQMVRGRRDAIAEAYSQIFGETFKATPEQIRKIYEWLKVHHYASGARRIKQNELAWTQEKGLEAIIRPSDGAILTPLAKNDAVLNAQATQNIWDMANNPLQFIKDTLSSVNVPANISGGSYDIQQNMAITLPNVMNYPEFVTALQNDKKFERMMQDMTINQLNKKNSLAKYKYQY